MTPTVESKRWKKTTEDMDKSINQHVKILESFNQFILWNYNNLNKIS